MYTSTIPHHVRQMTRQIQDDEFMIDNRSTGVNGSTQKRDTNPAPTRLVEPETFEASSEFGHCVLPGTQQNIMTMRPTGRCTKYANDNDASRGVRTNKSKVFFKDSKS